jgi:hypothetical protein
MAVDETKTFVYFHDGIHEVMRYSDLNVWGANGVRLEARFRQIDESRVSIVVDDSTAEYPILVDPISHYFGATGDQSNCKFGYSVAFGNVSSGYGDALIVGAPNYDNGQTDEGRVFVFYRSALDAYSSSPDWTAESNQAFANLGYSVASGDVNGDGVPDVIVGAPYYDNFTDDGSAFLWYGSSTGFGSNGTPLNADWQTSGGQRYMNYGWSVAMAGDVDGNGYKDVIVGAPYFNYYSSTSKDGKVFVFHSTSSGPKTSASWTAVTTQGNCEFGFAVAGAGDVNGDGYSDIIVGAPSYDNGQTDEGLAFLWYGGSGGLGTSGTPANADRTLEKNQASAKFGYSVASAGNVNGDSYGDVIVGAPLYDNTESNEGACFVYHGSSTGIPASESWSAESNQANAQLGFSVAGAFDLGAPADGYDEVVIGMPYYDYLATTNGGGTLVFYGSSTGLGSNGTPANADYAAYNVTSNDANSGWSVSTGRNIKYQNHSGFGIGSPGETGGGVTGRGAVNVFAE